MKRGRPSLRYSIQKEIIFSLGKFNTPVTIAVISKELRKTLNQEISWNTVQKYIRELVESGRVYAVQLPHSKVENKLGLVVYTLKK